jgi:hypothetical protein
MENSINHEFQPIIKNEFTAKLFMLCNVSKRERAKA